MALVREELPRHIESADWLATPGGEPRGYIDPHALHELWIHTGTACNLACPFCLEGSKPGDHRLQQMAFDEARALIDEASLLGVAQFSFTGGEPFVNRDFARILDYALERGPCLVLTNGTKPLIKRLGEIEPLLRKPNPLRFRISFDHPEPARHDAARGEGNFRVSLETLAVLQRMGFGVSIARHAPKGEDTAAADTAFRRWFAEAGVPDDTRIVAFPEFYPPGAHPEGVPEITRNCMTKYHTEASRAAFMCAFSKMAVKQDGRIRIYACTLVDDDPGYALGGTLHEAMRYRVMLRHHRCFTCFAYGSSCSETR